MPEGDGPLVAFEVFALPNFHEGIFSGLPDLHHRGVAIIVGSEGHRFFAGSVREDHDDFLWHAGGYMSGRKDEPILADNYPASRAPSVLGHKTNRGGLGLFGKADDLLVELLERLEVFYIGSGLDFGLLGRLVR